MAYLDHSSTFGEAEAIPVPADVRAQAADGFNPLEWSVIALARNDRMSSLTDQAPIVRVVSRLFGYGRHASLANPRLEALRRIAVHAWHRGAKLPASLTETFHDAGFSPDQLATLLASIATKHATSRRKALA